MDGEKRNKVITPRITLSLHGWLRAEAHRQETIMNELVNRIIEQARREERQAKEPA